MDSQLSTPKGSKMDLLIGSVLALGVILVASLARSWMILFVVPFLGVVSLVISWGWHNSIFRGFAVTLVVLTLTAFAAYQLVYLPYILRDLLGISH